MAQKYCEIMLESLEINDNFASRSEKEYAQVAELVDALVSNTSELTLMSVRSRPRVLSQAGISTHQPIPAFAFGTPRPFIPPGDAPKPADVAAFRPVFSA